MLSLVGQAAFCSLLGKDPFGDFYASEFEDLGIALQANLEQGETTGTCLVLITPDSERTLNTTLAVNTNFSRQHVNEDLIKASEWLYIEGYKLTDDSGAEAVDMAAFYAKKYDTNIAVTCSDKFIVDVFGDRLKGVLKHTDLIFCNEVEASALAEEEDVNNASKALQSRFRNVVLTMGNKGSIVKWDGREATVPAYAVDPVDTTGAGDMYAAGFLYGVLHRYHPEHAGRLASFAAAQVVAQYGARLKANHIEVRDTVLASAENTFMIRPLLTSLLLLVAAPSVQAQSGMQFDELQPKLQPYFADELIGDVRDALPQGADYRIWGWDVGDFTGDGYNDLALSIHVLGTRKRMCQVYLFGDIDGFPREGGQPDHSVHRPSVGSWCCDQGEHLLHRAKAQSRRLADERLPFCERQHDDGGRVRDQQGRTIRP